jgi:hypothetical protein
MTTPTQAFEQALDLWVEHKKSCSLCSYGVTCADGRPLRAEMLRLARLAQAWADD